MAHEMPSTSNHIVNTINSSDFIESNGSDEKRLKIDQQLIDCDDTCSNDAFMFKVNQNGHEFNSNDKIPTVK